MKWKNEEGYTLLSVLLSFLILTTLGMVLLAASINGANRTEIRETEIRSEERRVGKECPV